MTVSTVAPKRVGAYLHRRAVSLTLDERVEGSTRPLAGRTVLIANPSPDVYGSDLQMLESVSALHQAGCRVVVALPQDGPLVTRLRDRGAEVRFLSFLAWGLTIPLFVPVIRSVGGTG